jgi:hypothetical protein
VCDLEADYTTLLGRRRSVRRVLGTWSRLPSMRALGLLEPPTVVDIRHLGDAYGGDETPVVAFLRHGLGIAHVVAAQLQTDILVHVRGAPVLCEPGFTARPAASTGTGPPTVQLDTSKWPSPVLPTINHPPKQRGRRVAVVDTGDTSGGNMVTFDGPKAFDGTAQDDNGHGTAVGDIIRAAAQTTPSVRAVRVAQPDGSCNSYDVLSGLVFCLWGDQFDVVNVSLSTLLPSQCSSALGASLSYLMRLCQARNPDLVLVAAAGNEPTEQIAYPALMPGAHVVLATDRNGKPAQYNSQLPSGVTTTTESAFGGSTGDGLGRISRPGEPDEELVGTSYAAALVTAAMVG